MQFVPETGRLPTFARGRSRLSICAAVGNQQQESRWNNGDVGRGESGDAAAARSSGRGGRSGSSRDPNGRRGGSGGRFSGRDGAGWGAGERGRGRGRGQGWRGGRGPRRAADEYSDDMAGNAIDDGFIVIGRSDRRTAATAQAAAAVAAAPEALDPSAPPPVELAAPDPLDGSRFWIEASGIGGLDEEDEEDEENEEGEDEEDEDDGEPKTPEELLDNMRRQGFSLQRADESPEAAAAAASSGGAVTAADEDAAAASNSGAAPALTTAAPPSLPGLPAGSGSAGAALALRDLRDTFIATMKPPVLPPWFLGPVEVTATAGGTGKRLKAGAGVAAASAAVGRGTALRTTQAVAPGELLAVSLPLAICYCRRGTTPENEDLADAMMSGGSGGAAAAAAAARAAAARTASVPAVEASAVGVSGDLSVFSRFNGLTDLQQSLLACLWRGADAEEQQQTAPTPSSGSEVAAATTGSAARGGGPGAARSGAGGGGGGGTAAGGPVRRALLEMVAKSAADGGAPRSAPLVAAPELYRLVNLNCMGEDFQDLALCELRGERPLGHIALWPEAAFTGHSCAPNATAYAVGDRLVLRAAAEIPKGGEVSLNWLGSLLTSPLEVRRQELRQQYGFTCGCVRCTAESRYSGTPLGALLQSTHAACQELSPRLDGAIAAGDMAAVAAARSRLLAMQVEVEGALRVASPKVNAKTRRWLQACVYDMYDLISLCADELAAAAALGNLPSAPSGNDEADEQQQQQPRWASFPRGGGGSREAAPAADPVETESLAQCARIVEGVTPGSDGNVYLAAELTMRALQRFGQQHEEYRQARAALVRAYGARYGNVGPEVMELLVAARLAAEAREEGAEPMDQEGEEGEEEA